MSGQLVQPGLTLMEFARGATLGFLEDIPEDKWCHQPIPGANHAAWVVGHLAATDDYFLTAVAGKDAKAPKEWEELFGMGSKPVGDAAKYPNPAELKDALRSRRDDLIAWFKSLSDAELLEPLPGDLAQFAPHKAAMACSIAWHEGLHAGQLTVVRKSLGIGPKFG